MDTVHMATSIVEAVADVITTEAVAETGIEIARSQISFAHAPIASARKGKTATTYMAGR
jgi:hypothetical protein